MEKIHHSPLLVAALVCGIMIPLFMWAQEGEVKDSHVLPSGFVMKFERMGGYSRANRIFWIYPDGRVINGRGETAKIPSDTVTQWLKIINPYSRPILSDRLMNLPLPSPYEITIYSNGTRSLSFGPQPILSEISDRLWRLVWAPLMGEPKDPDPDPHDRRLRLPIKVGGNVQESKLIRRVEPVYPELAKRARVEGRVLLVVTVDEEGNVSEIRVIGGHQLLVEAALSAVRQWKYSPTLVNGEAVPVITTVTVRFSFAAVGKTAVPVV